MRVKIKSLAAESKIIRKEQRKYPGNTSTHGALHWHRINDVRNESRAAQLAYGWLRGVPYKVLEPKANKPIDANRVLSLVKKFGCGVKTIDDVYKWVTGEPVTRVNVTRRFRITQVN